MPKDFTLHLERLIKAMFRRCNEQQDSADVISLRHELRAVYVMVERMKKENAEPQHSAVLHLLELIYERLHTIFDILDFCRTDSRPQTEISTSGTSGSYNNSTWSR